MLDEAESAARTRSQEKKAEAEKTFQSLRASAQRGIEDAVQHIIQSIAGNS
jgi:F0F1-type ATP synthase membrane subunit b/b'